MELTPHLARIAAHICGDGYLAFCVGTRSQKELRQHPRRKLNKERYSIRYVNTEKVLSKSFCDDVKFALSRKVVARPKFEYEVSGKWVYLLLKSLGAGKSRDWFISKRILNSSADVKSAWLQAFFDDEATVSVKQKRIVVNSVNYDGIKQVQFLLKGFKIDSVLRGPYNYKGATSFHLALYRQSLKKFEEEIGFMHPEKKFKLAKINGGTAI
ncbi:hypothetical protein C4580_05665 [Candidatus Woesearchaeota archaeon]|nr:MAG: hypothetical protein C4580_05665 [Candidatus Woesearchaeota archaeon]